MGAAVLPLVMTAVGTGLNYYNGRQVEKRQEEELARQANLTSKRQREADSLVANTLVRQKASNPNEERQASLTDYMAKLQQTHGNATGGLDQMGAVSDRYYSDASDANGDVANTGAKTADIFSRIDGPARQRADEGVVFARLASDLDRIRAKSASDAFLGDMRMRRIKPNPWLAAAAQVASGIGSAAGGSMLGSISSGGGWDGSLTGGGNPAMAGGWANSVSPSGTIFNYSP